MTSPKRPRWRESLRVRYAAIATVLAAIAFAVGGSTALRLYHESLVASVVGTGKETAGAVAAGERSGSMPDPIPMPVAAGVPRVQVLDAAGRVVSGDPASVQDPPWLSPPAGLGTSIVDVSGSPYLPEHHAVLVVVRTLTPGGPVVIVVAQSLDAADERAGQAVELSCVAAALCLVMVAAVAWLAVGRTLRRVERVRAQAVQVTASGDLSRRLTIPGRDELAALGATLDDMLAGLERSNTRQRRFVADAAHELRTPIAGLCASIEVAEAHPGTAREEDWLGELRDGHRRLGRLVDDLLVLSRLDENAPPRHRPVRLDGVLADAQRRASRPGVTVQAEATACPIVLGDVTQLERVIANLVDNAVRHARNSVRLAVAIESSEAVITVADDGAGIAPRDHERIFERFTRLEEDRSRACAGAGGSGLGLALVKELVRAHGGTTHVSRSDLGGARFTVRLPLLPEP